MDLLGLYLAGHLNTDSGEFDGFDGVMIAGLSGDVDEYIWKKHEQGLVVEPPQPPISPEFAALVRDILATGCLGATDCVLRLLDHSGNARKKLLEGIAEVTSRARQSGKATTHGNDGRGRTRRVLSCYGFLGRSRQPCAPARMLRGRSKVRREVPDVGCHGGGCRQFSGGGPLHVPVRALATGYRTRSAGRPIYPYQGA